MEKGPGPVETNSDVQADDAHDTAAVLLLALALSLTAAPVPSCRCRREDGRRRRPPAGPGLRST
jgi:hypothetical protein